MTSVKDDRGLQIYELFENVEEDQILLGKQAGKHYEIVDAGVLELISEFKLVFSEELKDFPPERKTKHKIETGVADPVYTPQYRLSPLEIETAEQNVAELLKKGFIQVSESPWSSSLLFVKKKDGTLRMCVDYRKLNDITKKWKFPIPRVDALLDSLGKARWYSKLDLCSGYYQVEVEKDSREKTAFSTSQGQFEFTVLSFGLSNAPATFMNLMNELFRSLIGKSVIVYLDDILIFSATKEEHLKHLREVFIILKENRLIAKESKCEFMLEEIQFLGFNIGSGVIKPDPSKIAYLKKIVRPTTIKEVRSFVGFINFYRRFIPDCSRIAAPLTNLTRKGVKFEWGQA